MIDLVFPKGNERKFISVATKLGYKSIIFIYDEKSFNSAPKIKSDAIKIYQGYIGNKKLGKLDGSLVLLDSNNRSRFRKEVDFVFNVEEEGDFIHQRGGGLNDGLFKLMRERKIGYLVTLDKLRSPSFMGKLMQNVTMCNKYSVDKVLVSGAKDPHSMRNPSDIESLAKLIGLKDIKKERKKLEKRVRQA